LHNFIADCKNIHSVSMPFQQSNSQGNCRKDMCEKALKNMQKKITKNFDVCLKFMFLHCCYVEEYCEYWYANKAHTKCL